MKTDSERISGFSQVDLMMVLAVVAVLVVVSVTAAGNTREGSQAVVCMNNLKRLGMAMLMYSAENRGYFPERAVPRWPERLRKYYQKVEVLHCPGDVPRPANFGYYMDSASADAAPRSYLFNGFTDMFTGFPTNHSAMAEARITDPAGTALLGEKKSNSGHFYLDWWTGDDLWEPEQERHFKMVTQRGRGGSNYSFADGSVRFLGYGQSLMPTNLWLVDEELRALGWSLP